jgi:hypothetical protein
MPATMTRPEVAACCTANRVPLLTRNRKDFEPLEDHGLTLL